jgi:hypothetical protein
MHRAIVARLAVPIPKKLSVPQPNSCYGHHPLVRLVHADVSTSPLAVSAIAEWRLKVRSIEAERPGLAVMLLRRRTE